jgi:hypothetical protein
MVPVAWWLYGVRQDALAAPGQMKAAGEYTSLTMHLSLNVLDMQNDCLERQLGKRTSLHKNILDFQTNRTRAGFILSDDRTQLDLDEKGDATPAAIERDRNHLDADTDNFGKYMQVDLSAVAQCDISTLPDSQ